jgi:MscS family membrane protein
MTRCWHGDCNGAGLVSMRRLWLIPIFSVGILSSALHVAAAPSLTAAPAPSAVPSSEKAEASEPVAADSPRAAIVEFRKLTRAGDYAGASRFLELSGADSAEGAVLAQHLKEVLNRRLWVDPSKLSPESHGNGVDGQPLDSEQLGTIRAASGKLEPVTLVRKNYRTGARWVFSASTVSQIEGWYDHLESLWLSEHVPKPLLHMGPRLLRWWQWLALGPLLLVAWLSSWLVTRAARAIATRLLQKEQAAAAHQLHGPVSLALAVGVAYAALPWLGLYQPAEQFLTRWGSALLMVALFWALWRGVELSRRRVSSLRWAQQSGSAHSLLSLGARLAKFVVAAAAFMIVLSQLGYQATTILTGLGIGGVAVALAAQKTVENLFGTFSLAVDQPFREGDAIKVDGIEGVVEAVGLRSTRIRSADRSLISIPNGKLADMRVETISRQDRLRFYCQLNLSHDAVARIEQISSELKALLAREPLVMANSVGVRLIAINDFALTLELVALLDTTEGSKFMDAKERLLLGALRVIESTGATFAHPERRIELVSPNQAPTSGLELSRAKIPS